MFFFFLRLWNGCFQNVCCLVKFFKNLTQFLILFTGLAKVSIFFLPLPRAGPFELIFSFQRHSSCRSASLDGGNKHLPSPPHAHTCNNESRFCEFRGKEFTKHRGAMRLACVWWVKESYPFPRPEHSSCVCACVCVSVCV